MLAISQIGSDSSSCARQEVELKKENENNLKPVTRNG
jgi:hypothetical protein